VAIREEVSGIGSMSKRTDLNVSNTATQPARYISGMPYGQGQATYNQQTAAPMAAVNDTAMPAITELLAPTNLPNQPITAGVDFGPGPGSEVINLPNTQPTVLSVLRQIAQNDPTGETDLIFQSMLEKGLG
jgi:hypothetical protein